MNPRIPNVRCEAAQGDAPATLYIYDDIGPDWMGLVGGKTVAAALQSVPPESPLTVRINSVGGDVFEGTAIYNLLAARPGPTQVVIDGAALSAASLIAMAGSEVRMADNAYFMIHDPWTIALGSPDELVEAAATMEKMAGNIARTYASRTGKSEAEIRGLMKAETWLSAEEARDAGFVDAVIPSKSKPQISGSNFTINRFRAMPQRVAAMLRPDAPEPEDEAMPNDPKPAPVAASEPAPAATPAAAEPPPAVRYVEVSVFDALQADTAKLRADLAAANQRIDEFRARLEEMSKALEGQKAVVDNLRGEARPAAFTPAEPKEKPTQKSAVARAIRFAPTPGSTPGSKPEHAA